MSDVTWSRSPARASGISLIQGRWPVFALNRARQAGRYRADFDEISPDQKCSLLREPNKVFYSIRQVWVGIRPSFVEGRAGAEHIMKSIAMILSVGAMAGLSGFASAEPYQDYTPIKGVIEVQMIKVDPNHIDDYLTGLKTNLVPGLEIAKKHGVIDWYRFDVKLNSNGGDANVMIVQHYPSLAVLDPDKARDQTMEKESYEAVSKATQEKTVAGFDKYRTFVSDEFYGEIEYTK